MTYKPMKAMQRICLLIIGLCLVGCHHLQADKVTGDWYCSPGKSTFKVPLNSAQRLANLKLTLDPDGTCKLLGFSGTWKLDSDKVLLDLDSQAGILRSLQDSKDEGQSLKIRFEDGLMLWDVGPDQGALIFERRDIAAPIDGQIV